MSKLSKSRLNEILLDYFAVSRAENGDAIVELPPSEGGKQVVTLYFSLGEETDWLRIMAFCRGFTLPSDQTAEAIVFCNDYNNKVALGGASFGESMSTIGLSHTVPGVSDVPEDYLRTWIIRLMAQMACDFFSEVEKKFTAVKC